MKSENAAHILTRLATGFRMDSAILKDLERDWTATLQRARQFGVLHGTSGDWVDGWHRQWDAMEAILSRIDVLVDEMDRCVEDGVPSSLSTALEAWERIQTEDAKLEQTLAVLRHQASGMSEAVQADWNVLASTIDDQLEAIQALAEALRIKLELLKQHSKAEVDTMIQNVLSKLPARTDADDLDPAAYEREYHEATIALGKERHEFLGFMDIVKGLFMWAETPDERVRSLRKKLAVSSDRA